MEANLGEREKVPCGETVFSEGMGSEAGGSSKMLLGGGEGVRGGRSGIGSAMGQWRSDIRYGRLPY